MEKIAYSAPEIEDLGAFEEITQGASSGSALDGTFPVGTPFGQLTFS